MTLDDDSALVLLSGGQDSATCLAWALNAFRKVETLGFRYRQRHAVEMDCRERLLDGFREGFPQWRERLGADEVLDASVLADLGETAMTADVAIGMDADGLPNTFVPGRNIVFLTLAAGLGFRRGLRHLVAGVCETDYSGYPDCRDDTVKALQVALNLGMERRFVIHTPLMWQDKAATWALAEGLGGSRLVDLIREESHSCYRGERGRRHEWGYGCGACPACELRAAGWARYRGREA